MGDLRHFGERLETGAVTRAESDVCEAHPLASFEQPSPSVLDRPKPVASGSLHGHLARVIEGEILPRLMLAHKAGVRPAERIAGSRPTPDQIAQFCTLLLTRSNEDMTPHVLALLDEGLSLESLLLELLAPAARHLGELWEEDECDFVDVTVATGRLQGIMRDLCARLESDAAPARGNSILLLPCPGETHNFGLSMVATIFREAGWDVVYPDHGAGVDPIEFARVEWYDVIGLSLGCEIFLPALGEAVRSLRRVSRNRSVRIMVGGPLFALHPDYVTLVGADATADNAHVAPGIAESLLDLRARAC